MKAHSVLRQLQFGRIWFVLPVLGAMTALMLLAAWPELFSESLGAQADLPISAVAFDRTHWIGDFGPQVIA